MTDATATLTTSSIMRGRHHDILLVALVTLRPLIWSGDASNWDSIAWLLLVAAALIALVIDAWRGQLPAWRFGIGGVLAALLLIVFLPAALMSPFPSTGMAMWGSAIVHLGFAAYLVQIIAGRERLAFGALVSAVFIECLLALGQWWWVLPRMSAALANGDPEMLALENSHGDLAERLKNGGLFGTFTLANTLAAFLLLAGVPIIGLLQHTRHTAHYVIIAFLLVLGIIGIGTASKGAAIALIGAAIIVWTWHVSGRWRFAPLIAFSLIGLLCIVMPQIRDIGAASAHVRLGYWQGATTLITEAPIMGHGINSFAAHSARAMPLEAEPTQHVHNDILEAIVDGGIIAGICLFLLLLWVARKRLSPPIITETESQLTDNQKRTLHATWPLFLFLPIFSAIGMLATNIQWWPGGGEATWWLWPLVFSACAMGITYCIARLPLPPRWVFQLALTAFALHCLLDFNLQSPPIWGTLIMVAILAGGHLYALGVCTISRAVVTVLVVGLMSSIIFSLYVDRGRSVRAVNFLTNIDVPPLRYQYAQSLIERAQKWPARLDMIMQVLAELPPGEQRLLYTERFHKTYPWDGTLLEILAQDYAALGRYDDAITCMEKSVLTTPAYMPRRQRFIGLLTHAAEARPSTKIALHKRIDDEKALIEKLTPLVHQRNK